MPARNYKAQCGHAKFILNNSAIWLVNTKPQNMQIHCRISPRRTCNPCGNTMKISSRYHRLLIYDVKRNSEIDVWVPLKKINSYI